MENSEEAPKRGIKDSQSQRPRTFRPSWKSCALPEHQGTSAPGAHCRENQQPGLLRLLARDDALRPSCWSLRAEADAREGPRHQMPTASNPKPHAPLLALLLLSSICTRVCCWRSMRWVAGAINSWLCLI